MGTPAIEVRPLSPGPVVVLGVVGATFTGIVSTPVISIPGSDGSGASFGQSVAGGDVNGDGYADLMVGQETQLLAP